MHLDESVLDALVGGDLDAKTGRVPWQHLTECAECRSRFDQLVASERQVWKLLRTLDHRLPAVDVGAVIGRARTLSARARRRRRVAAWGAAAGATLAAALAAALPSSPVARYVRSMLDRPRTVPTSAVATTGATQQRPNRGGIAVDAAGDVQVTFLASQAAGEIRIAFGPDRTLRVIPVGDGTLESTRRFAIAPGAVTVDNAGSRASYQLTLPEAALHARLLIGARTVFAVDGHRVTTVATPDGRGHYVFRFSPPLDPRSQ